MTPNEQTIARMAANEQALQVGRPPGTSPGWTVWHTPSRKQAIQAVRYKRDAQHARADLLATSIDWTQLQPVPDNGSNQRAVYARIYRMYGRLRQAQLANNRDWPRPTVRESAS